MLKRKKNKHIRKRAGRKPRTVFCLLLLTVLCASTLSFGSAAFAGSADEAGQSADFASGIIEEDGSDLSSDQNLTPGEFESSAEESADAEEPEVSDEETDPGEDPGAGDGKAVSDEESALPEDLNSDGEDLASSREKLAEAAAPEESGEDAGEEEAEETNDESEPDGFSTLMEQYLKENLDPARVPTPDSLDPVGTVTVYDIYAYSDRLEPGDTVSGIMSAITKHDPTARAKVYNHRYANVALYDTDGEYYVAMLDTANIPVGGTLMDVRSLSGNSRNTPSCNFDRSTGIAYITKSSVAIPASGESAVKFQCMYSLDDAPNTKTVVLTATCRNGSEPEVSEAQFDLLDNAISVQTMPGLAKSEILLSVNGIPLTRDDFRYDAGSGLLTIELTAGGVYCVDVKAESTMDAEADLLTVRSRMAISDDIMPRSGGYAYLKKGYEIFYAGYSTHNYVIDGDAGYCVQPSANSPLNGSYLKHYDVENYVLNSNNNQAKQQAEQVRKILYYSYGAPGFEQALADGCWPSAWYNGEKMTNDRYYVLSHVLLSDVYSYDANFAMHDCYQSFVEWMKNHVIGRFVEEGWDSAFNNASTTRWQLLYDEPDPPDTFRVYVLNTGSTQNMLGWEYEPAEFGYAYAQKKADNPDIIKNNSNYSLTGATYYIYTDEACTKRAKTAEGKNASIITTANGNSGRVKMPLGPDGSSVTYFVKEFKASVGFDPDPKVYQLTVAAENTEDNPASFTSTEPHRSGSIEIQKSSGNESITDDNTLYTLKGAVYGIYTDKAGKEQVGTITTDSKGYGKSGSLLFGDYYIKELSRPGGYVLDDTTVYGPITLSSSASDPVIVKQSVSDAPISDRLGIDLYKIDEETGRPEPEGGASLAGAEFTVKYYNGYYSEREVEDAAPTRTWVIRTVFEDGAYHAALDRDHQVSGDAFYYDQSGSVILPLGTYTIRETCAPEGYLLQGVFTDAEGKTLDAGAVYYTQFRDDGSDRGEGVWIGGANKYTQSDTVIRGGVMMQKRDLESGLTTPEGNATLEGAVFEIVNENASPVLVEGTLFEPGEVVKTLTTDENGFATTEADILPYGTYKIEETKQPSGYLPGSIVLPAATEQTFEIREDGVIVDMTEAADSITDQVKRADFSFVKQDGENQSTDLGSVKFRLTSETTGESHVFWTDINGQYSSASDWEPHTQNTNRGESFEDGIWFYGYAQEDASGVEVDDRLGALPWDTYRMEELPCDSNEGRTLISTRFTIYGDNVELGERANVHLGTIDNYLYGFSTRASNAKDGRKYLDAAESAQIEDVIRYWGLDTKKPYTFVTELYDVTADEMIRDADGAILSVKTDFTAETKDGSKTVKIAFDASGLEGHTLVLFEYLYDGDGNLLKEEANADDEEQTVYLNSPDIPPEEQPQEEQPEQPQPVSQAPSAPSGPVRTGDEPLAIWLTVIAAAAACVIIICAGKKRQEKK